MPQDFIPKIGGWGVATRSASTGGARPPALGIILDEATSYLDSESEREVQQALDRLIAGRTTLVIAHRLSTVRNAQRIVVLEEGRVVESGQHADLLAAGGLYRRLYEIQFAREEDKEPALLVGGAPPRRQGSAQ